MAIRAAIRRPTPAGTVEPRTFQIQTEAPKRRKSLSDNQTGNTFHISHVFTQPLKLPLQTVMNTEWNLPFGSNLLFTQQREN